MSSASGKKYGLGKGIGSLMDDYTFDAVFPAPAGQEGQMLMLEINRIHPNLHQPRKQFDQESLDELAESIRTQGILQPLIVEKISEEEYAIIAGERRYRAALSAGLEKVPVIIKHLTDVQRLEVSLIENIQRENLNPIEEAKAYAYLIEIAEIKQEELAERVGKKRSTIANSMRLLQLPPYMQEALGNGDFTAGHARAILSLVNPADKEYLYRKILEEGLSVRSTEKLAAELNMGKRGAADRKKTHIKEKSADILALEQKLLEACGTRVEIKGTLQQGKLEISYHSMEDLERLYHLFIPGGDLHDV